MRNKRHRSPLVVGLLLCTLGATAVAQEQVQAQTQTDPQDRHQAPDTKPEKPEYSRRSLPADTFKPSEEISEDFAVPFPVDI